MYPDSPDANINLMAAYLRYQDYTDLGILEDQQLANPTQCVSCMLTLANIAADQKDPRRAILALGKASQSKQLTRSRDGLHLYYLAIGKVLILQGQLADAEKPLEISTSLSPSDVRPRLVLAHDLAREGKSDSARQTRRVCHSRAARRSAASPDASAE
jgi:Flp pilus assembly protein TadD